MGEEKRKHPRLKCLLPADIIKAGTRNRLIERASIQDISSQGAKLTINFNLNPGSNMEIKLSLPEKNLNTSVSGEIVWIKQKDDKIEAGLKIKEMDKKAKKEILNWIFPKWSETNSPDEENEK